MRKKTTVAPQMLTRDQMQRLNAFDTGVGDYAARLLRMLDNEAALDYDAAEFTIE